MICRYYGISDSTKKDTVIKGVLEDKTLLLKKASEYTDKTEFKNFKVYANLKDKKRLKRNFNLNQTYIESRISFEEYFKQLNIRKFFMKDIIYDTLNKYIGTVCFSTRTDNVYLWNNYAGKDGFCVVYNDELRNMFKPLFTGAGLPNLFKKVDYSDKDLIYNLSSLKHIFNFALEVPFRKRVSNSDTNENYYKEEELRLAIQVSNPETGERFFWDEKDKKDKIWLEKSIYNPIGGIDNPIKYVIANKCSKYFNEIETCCKKESIELKWRE